MSALNPETLVAGILKGDTATLGRAITLVESTLATDQAAAGELVKALLPHTGRSLRIAISGVPGVGKSTFIEALGKHLTSLKKRVAVLAVDPSSLKTKGSILGDKTRMEELAKDPLAFVRPTPAGGHLGGVAGRTREAILLCEAAGYEVVLIETVGVGQSEIQVRNMVDYLTLLMLAGAGDELQGVKKGILEMSDLVVINKCDDDNIKAAMRAKADLQHALHILSLSSEVEEVVVMTASARDGAGIADVWEKISTDCARNRAAILLRRKEQNHLWMEERLFDILRQATRQSRILKERTNSLDDAVRNGDLYPPDAAMELWHALRKEID
jgi:LAO/AO transport system kinase